VKEWGKDGGPGTNSATSVSDRTACMTLRRIFPSYSSFETVSIPYSPPSIPRSLSRLLTLSLRYL
jgi:hypothetical protein